MLTLSAIAMRRVAPLLAVIVGSQALADRVVEVQLSGSDPQYAHGTWVGVFRDPIRPGDLASRWAHTEVDTVSVGVPDTATATIVAVRQGVVSSRSIASQEHGPVSLRFERGFSVGGVVRDIHGRGIADANVVFSPSAGTDFDLPRLVWPQWSTDEDGIFNAHGLAAGHYTALADADGYVMLDDVEVEIPDQPGRVEIAMTPAFHVAGVVLVGIDEQPAVGAEVAAHAKGGRVGFAETDSQGRFRLGPFAVGQGVRVAARGDDGRSSDSVHLIKPQEGLALRLKDGVRLTGTVADGTTGTAVTRFVLTAYGNGEVLGSFSIRDTGGAFDTVVDWRTDVLTVAAPGYSLWSGRAPLTAGERSELGRILVEPRRPLSGLVIDSSTGTPVAGATVSRHGVLLSYEEHVGGETTITDPGGRFELSHASGEGYSLRVSAHGYAHRTVHFKGTTGHAAILILGFCSGCSLGLFECRFVGVVGSGEGFFRAAVRRCRRWRAGTGGRSSRGTPGIR